MVEDWLTMSWTEVWLVVVSAAVMMAAIIATVRIVGLRSLSKMSSFDFLVTVALGSILATVVVSSTSVAHGMVAVASLLAIQAAVAFGRQRGALSPIVDNEPLLLMRNGRFHQEALRASRVTQADVLAKLREANVTDMDQVLGVVLESTGDVSVLHGPGPLDDSLIVDVRVIGSDTAA